MLKSNILVRAIEPTDSADWLRLRLALWPDSDRGKVVEEITHFFAMPARPLLPTLHAAFVCEQPDGALCGLVEVSIRSSAPGCKTDRIGYLEAWYVDEGWRGKGVGRALVERAEVWAIAQGCLEMASDTTPDYPLSPGAHEALGYKETIRHFHKDIN